MKIEEWHLQARKREIPEPLPTMIGAYVLDLGAGKNPVDGALPLDLERGWNADTDVIPVPDRSVDVVVMHGFLDYVKDPVAVLREVARVLRTGGHTNIVLPHGLSELAASDIHKKSRWTEESWRNLFDSPHYTPEGEDIPLMVWTCFIIGVTWRNLSLFTQLVKL